MPKRKTIQIEGTFTTSELDLMIKKAENVGCYPLFVVATIIDPVAYMVCFQSEDRQNVSRWFKPPELGQALTWLQGREQCAAGCTEKDTIEEK